MKRIALALVVIALAAGCKDKNPNNPTPANPVFTSTLTTANEVPAVMNAEQGASGTVRIDLAVTRDASNVITAATATFTVTLTGFPAGSAITTAHIHQATAGQTAGVLVSTGLAAGEVTLTNGSGGFTKSGVNVTPAQAQAIIDNPAGFYFNVHTSLNPTGAIRGQLARQ